MIIQYANLLADYCLQLKEGDKLLVKSTTLAEPLVIALYEAALKRGAVLDFDVEMKGRVNIFNQFAYTTEQLQHLSPLYTKAVNEYNAYLFIMAPHEEHNEPYSLDEQKQAVRVEGLRPVLQLYNKRTSEYSLRRSLCLFPTPANAQRAGMSLSEYEHFVYSACKLYDENPIESWKLLGDNQKHIVDYLNKCNQVRYINPNTDISFSTQGRTWINSDGRTNMPSGEVYTSPVEDSVEGTVHFDYPCIFEGQEVEGVTLDVKAGEIVRWDAKKGIQVLNKVFNLPGTRRFGEAAIGTNYQIDRFTKNILFDEKIGGSIHMAIGQSYFNAGGKNESPIHWDMIADMTKGGQILADGHKIYENGQFLLLNS